MARASIPQYESVVAEAASFAVRAHEGQYRKGTGFPYVVHPIGVAHILRDYYPGDDELEAAGYLHDVIEDCNVNYSHLAKVFGFRVANLVIGVTNTGKWTLEEYASVPDVLRLKAADTIDNVTDTVRGLEKGHDVWSRFSAGKRKADTWRKHADLIWHNLPHEPIAVRLHDVVLRAEALRTEDGLPPITRQNPYGLPVSDRASRRLPADVSAFIRERAAANEDIDANELQSLMEDSDG